MLFALVTGILLLTAIISYLKIKQFEDTADNVIHTNVVKEDLADVLSYLKDAETGQRGYLLSGDTVFLQPYNGAEQRIAPLLAALDSLMNDNAVQQRQLKNLKILVAERLWFLKNNIAVLKNHLTNALADPNLLKSKNKMDEVRAQVALMMQNENQILQKRILAKDRSESVTPVLLLLLSLFAILALTFFFIRLQRETGERISTQLTVAKKDEFINIATHEMKTPLTTAKAYVQLVMASSSPGEDAQKYARKATEGLDKLNRLVSDLSDASKIQDGKLHYNLSSFDFNKMLDDTIAEVTHIEKKHTLQKIGNCSRLIKGDKERLQQVVTNLLSNAVKYSPQADKIIVKVEEADDKIKVAVQDFGLGIDKAHVKKIFERYYRIEEHAHHYQGMGVGLYISHNIIQRHNGTMWVESEPGQGSTFYFTVPV